MTNDRLPELGPYAHLLFAGLWMVADREGRLEDRPKKIRGECMPHYDGVDIEELLVKLAEGDDPFILRYEVGGKRYIQIVKWRDHQSPHHTEKVSVIPEPPLDNGEVTDTSRPSSLLDATSNQKPVTSNQQPEFSSSEGESEGKPAGSTPTQLAKPGSTPNKPPSRFDLWWSTVPNKVGKQAARRAYDLAAKLIRSRPPDAGPGGDDPHAFLLERMAAFAAAPLARGQYCPHPATWLNAGRYDDDERLWQNRRHDPRNTASAAQDYLDG